MDISHVQPFVKAAQKTFKTLCKIDVIPSPPVQMANEEHYFDISAMVGLGGSNVQGMVTMGFKKEHAIKVVSAFLGATITESAPEFTDGIGELVNIISGYAKQFLPEQQITISIPQVIVGDWHTLRTLKGVPTYFVSFDSPFGVFAIEVSLKIS